MTPERQLGVEEQKARDALPVVLDEYFFPLVLKAFAYYSSLRKQICLEKRLVMAAWALMCPVEFRLAAIR